MATKEKIEAGASAMRSAYLKRAQADSWERSEPAYLEDAEACIDAAEFVESAEKIEAGAKALRASAVRRALRHGNELVPWEDLRSAKKLEYREDAEACIDAANTVSKHTKLPDTKIEVGARAIWLSTMPPGAIHLDDYRGQAEACIDAAKNVRLNFKRRRSRPEQRASGAPV
jgi:hypothetical protein